MKHWEVEATDTIEAESEDEAIKIFLYSISKDNCSAHLIYEEKDEDGE